MLERYIVRNTQFIGCALFRGQNGYHLATGSDTGFGIASSAWAEESTARWYLSLAFVSGCAGGRCVLFLPPYFYRDDGMEDGFWIQGRLISL